MKKKIYKNHYGKCALIETSCTSFFKLIKKIIVLLCLIMQKVDHTAAVILYLNDNHKQENNKNHQQISMHKEII